ncbi:hypothetical protein J5N97_014271 [Dioscorea zingiberensis]|uniref:Pentatricopeptide repeat-containing protein n=1 Tax=Dioscorea zingiberensis TaxID=325984 RepID=A0A9D5HJW8_9LILI|nr:hypothetical protein J5N97_014271 [Dioscorea zingiberensis]
MRAVLLRARKFTNTSWNPPLTRFRNYEAILNALTQPSIALPSLEGLHALIITNGLSSKSVLSCRLISSYLSISGLQHAHKVFDYLPKRSSHAYNHILSAYIDQEHYRAVFKLYFQMLSAGEALPDVVTFSIILKACVALNSLPHGMLVHGHVLEFGMESDLRLATDILILYTKCGSLDFAVKQFELMHQRDAFAWTAMVDGYLRLGCVAEALDMFGKMRELGLTASVVTWNALISGLAREGLICDALFQLNQMQEDGVRPDKASLCAIIPMFARSAVLKPGREAHAYMIRNGMELDLLIISSLVDMYAKCGLLVLASHSGLVTEGRRIYDIMISEYKILARQEHYACMVDMLGRAGYLEDAFVFIKNLPEEPTRDVWGAFLSACRVHSDAKLAEIATENLMRFTSGSADAGYHIAMSNVYAENGRWGKMAQLRTQMRDVGLKKRVGYSWIEVGNSVHTFSMADDSHLRSNEIYTLLMSLNAIISEHFISQYEWL